MIFVISDRAHKKKEVCKQIFHNDENTEPSASSSKEQKNQVNEHFECQCWKKKFFFDYLTTAVQKVDNQSGFHKF